MRRVSWVLGVIFIGYVFAKNKDHPHNIDDNMNYEANKRIMNMSYELIAEAKVLQRQINHIQDFYQGYITYEVGYVIGKIRDRYKRMIEIYKQAHYMTKHLYLDSKNISQLNTSFALKPGIRMYYPINWVINMEYVRLIEVDIDKLVDVIEKIPSYALVDSEGGGNVPFVHATGGASSGTRGKLLRSGPSNIPNSPPLGSPNERPMEPPNEPPLSSPNEPPLGPTNELSMGLRNEQPLVSPNEQPLGPPNKPPLGSPNEQPLGLPNDLPLGLPNEPPLDQPNEPSMGLPNEQPLGPPNEQPLGLPNEPPLDSSNESPPGPMSQSFEPQRPPNDPSAPSNGEVIRFGSADTNNFRTEEELKKYYRQMYREKHGRNIPHEHLYG